MLPELSRYIFSKFQHEQPVKGKSIPKSNSIHLTQYASTERSLYFDGKQLAVKKHLENMRDASSDIQLAIRLFQEMDVDGSGKYLHEDLWQEFCDYL
jgi:hypothetical protein